jgi:hypothetical protein
VRDNFRAAFHKADAFGVQANADLFALQDIQDGRRHVFVLAMNQARSHFEYGDLAAEAAEHLAKLKSDVAAADDDQVFGKEIDSEQGAVGEIFDVLESGELGHVARAPTLMKICLAVRRSEPTLTS